MNRREALAALTSLPIAASVTVADVKAEDVIVIECESRLSPSGKEHLKEQLNTVWPGRKVLVFDGGLKLKVLRHADHP